MPMLRLITIILGFLVLLSWAGLALDDHSAERDQATDLEAAQHQARAHARYDIAVQRLCGPNAGWMELQDGAIQCTTKRGTPTRRVTLTTTTTTTAEATP